MANLEINKLKQLRLDRGLTLRKLSEKADLDPATVSLIENGHRKAQIVTLSKLAAALDVPINDLAEFLDTGASERAKAIKKEDQAA